MPILSIEVVADGNDVMRNDLAQALADAVGHAFKSPRGERWIRLRVLPRNQYAENKSVPEAAELPVFVTVLKRKRLDGAELKAEEEAITRAVAEIIGRSTTCVHIEFTPSAAGRFSFGGKLV